MTSSYLRIFIAAGLFAGSAFGQVRMPEPNPPFVVGSEKELFRTSNPPSQLDMLPSLEWTIHKSSDGLHPSGSEQQMLWLMNRARRSPSIEGIWLAHLRQSNVQEGMDYFEVMRDVLMDEFAARTTTPPAAFDARLYIAARSHSAYLISTDAQNHTDQFQRILDEGFRYTSARGSVFSYSKDAIYGHAGFNVDWGGSDESGMQTGRGHREGLMGAYSCVGIACVEEDNPSTNVGPVVTTINYCNANASCSDHHNLFVVGTVWNDANTNALYDPGEGIGNVTVMPNQGTYFAITGTAGGYAIPLGSGTYTLTYSGGELPSNVVKCVTIDSVSLLEDVELSGKGFEMTASATISQDGMLTFVLSEQRKGCAYSLVTSTNLLLGVWKWAGTLPIGYGNSLTYNAPLIEPDSTERFMTLRGWRY